MTVLQPVFRDVEQIAAHTKRIHSLLPASVGPALWGIGSAMVSVTGPTGAATYDAVKLEVVWDDAGGDKAMLTLPPAVSAEAVAAILFALTEVKEWS